MKSRILSTSLVCILNFVVMMPTTLNSNAFNFESKNALLKIQDGATLQIQNQLIGFDGTLYKGNDARIAGQNIFFNNGSLKAPGKKSTLLGTYDPNEERFLLFDNEVFIGSGIAWQPITIYGANTRIQGQPTFTRDVTLNDSNASVTFDVQSTLNCNVVLNSGTVQLDSDLRFANYVGFVNDGYINLLNNSLVLGGAPLEWYSNFQWNTAGTIELNNKVTVYATQTMGGSIAINGNGNIIDLSYGGTLSISSGSYLYLSNVVIKGLGRGSIQWADDSSVLYASNVTFELADNFNTNTGMININGPCTVITQDKTWNFGGSSRMVIDGVTVWKDKAGAHQTGTIQFEDPVTQLELIESGTIATIGCCEQVAFLETRVQSIEAEIEELVTVSQFEACCTTLQHQVDLLMASTAFLQYEIDQLQTDTHCGHVIRVEGAYTFNEQQLLQENHRLIYEFEECDPGLKPVLTFQTNSQVLLPLNSALLFKGQGTIQVQDGVQFTLLGTSTQDQAFMNIGDKALFTLDNGANVVITGSGTVELSDWGLIRLNDPCQLHIGQAPNDHVKLSLARYGGIQLGDFNANLTIGVGSCTIESDMFGFIDVLKGLVNFKARTLEVGINYLTALITEHNYLFNTKEGQVVICDSLDDACIYYDIDGSLEKSPQIMPILLPVKVVR